MGYGVWSKHGKGYAVLEVDNPGVRDQTLDAYKANCLRDNKVGTFYFLIRGLDKYGVDYHGDSDVNVLRWELGQRRRNPRRRHFQYAPYAGDHMQYVAYDNKAALDRAIEKGRIQPQDVINQCGTLYAGR